MMKQVDIPLAVLLAATEPRTSYMHAKCSTPSYFLSWKNDPFQSAMRNFKSDTRNSSETLERILSSVSTIKGCNTFLIFSNRKILNPLRVNTIHVKSQIAKNKVADQKKKSVIWVKNFFKLKIILQKHHFTIEIFISFV